ncbi:TPA: hemophore [Yersinia enterocolitica]|uniref:heme acquisition protein HasA n=1 Tax=Yersinia enterocolitica TaxID=630 RepID=UPI0005E033D3|nr:heme acquisition protein HasA [Yersinia enterocolitica]EKN3601260.1 hemophore [Yersinia enterocolitica]EKN3781448.1 hemophore [Yersinia enterocolitica]EKN3872585.1 hemophore [Yersinia enterocolitica]EKN3969393.1 hemophore [Yersinia enterocolitica]EKN4012321.1 hemophore [Yersinia enterocolitica]
MTVTIRYSENIKDETIYSYTHKWIADFNIPTEEGSNFGGFHGLKDSITRQFEQFSVTNTSGDKATIILSGEISFNLCHRAIYGKVESLELGKEGLIQNVNSHIIIEKHLVEPQLIFNDLNIIGEYDDFKITAENRKNDIHQIGFNLKKDNADILLEILKTQGVDVSTPLKDMASASQFNMPVIDTLGTNDNNEILLAA